MTPRTNRGHRGPSLLRLLPILLLVAGCFAGRSYSFRHDPRRVTRLSVPDGAVLVLPARDLRPQIVEEGEPPSWVGEQRNRYGIPFNVVTADGRTLAQVVADAVADDLEAAGFAVRRSPRLPEDRPASPGERGARRGVEVVLHELNANTYVRTDVEWDLEVRVVDADGREVARHRDRGRATLPGNFLNPPAAARRQVPPFFFDLLRGLVVKNPDVLRALDAPAPGG